MINAFRLVVLTKSGARYWSNVELLDEETAKKVIEEKTQLYSKLFKTCVSLTIEGNFSNVFGGSLPDSKVVIDAQCIESISVIPLIC